MSTLELSALKLLIAAAGAIVILLRFRKSPLMGGTLRWPPAAPAAAWYGLYIAWMIASDVALGWRGSWDFEPWQNAPLLASICRVLAVVVAGPLLEELVFRGLLFGLLLRRGVSAPLTILITAIGWSLLHVDYSASVIAVIGVAGVILGMARWRTGSVLLPIAMHMSWNLYAVW